MNLSMKTTRVYHPWTSWECYAAGMYDGMSIYDADTCKKMYAEFLADTQRFEAAMIKVAECWPLSCEHFLTNDGINRIAWLGQAAMCMDTGISRRHRAGYMLLTDEQKRMANGAAARFLTHWLRTNSVKDRRLRVEVEANGLFG